MKTPEQIEHDNHYAWVDRMAEDYVCMYEGENNNRWHELVMARIRNLVLKHAPAPSQMCPREVEKTEELERLRSLTTYQGRRIDQLTKERANNSTSSPPASSQPGPHSQHPA